MKEKKGFIFVETIIVIVVVMVLLVTIYSSFSLILSNIKRKENYDNINDVYKANLVIKLFTSDVSENYITLTSSDCSTYMTSDCDEVMGELGIESIFVNKIPLETILSSIPNLPAPLIGYLSTLDQQKNYIIVSCNRNNQIYYASLEYIFND